MYRYQQRYGELFLLEYNIIILTPAGKWIEPTGVFPANDYRKRFVRNIGKKRFAYETKKEALLNFIRRTERHIMFMKSNIGAAEDALYKANALFKEMK